ncbi:MAG: hypothetical protein AAF570_21705, partial [Bacteroidota bacterium]
RPLDDLLYAHIGDRRLERMFFSAYILLIFSVLQTLLFPNFAKSQISNELCFETLSIKFLEGQPIEYKEVKGFTTPGLSTQLKPVASAPAVLKIDPPVVTYEKVGKGKYLREMTLNFVFTDSTDHEYGVSQTDTLNRKDIRTARATKFKELRGEHPGPGSKYLIPALIIGTGLSGIISLFYIRSS